MFKECQIGILFFCFFWYNLLGEFKMTKEQKLEKIENLYNAYKQGLLGGEIMPEDSNPNLPLESKENYLYFTLPMALNYQRNSYKLWESAKKTYEDLSTRFIFNTKIVLSSTFEEVQNALVKYRLALQKEKQTQIWIKLCETIENLLNGDIRNIFKYCDYDVNKIRNYMQKSHKKDFPYLSGNKLCNYWMYVIYQYTDTNYINKEDLTIAPDIHVLRSSVKLEIITQKEFEASNAQIICIDNWNKILKGTKFAPIDIHTPLWLWGRSGFKEIEQNNK